jgi:hypothetical protein
MRVMAIIRATERRESGAASAERVRTAMGQYNDVLVRAGVLLDGESLHGSSRGARVRFAGSARTVIEGPFTNGKELVAGYWLWQVRSLDEAIEWAKRCPDPLAAGSEIEIRQVLETEDVISGAAGS